MAGVRADSEWLARLRERGGARVQNSTLRRYAPLKNAAAPQRKTAHSEPRKTARPGSVSAAKAAAWTAFSRLIRTRDCIRTSGNPYEGDCCTCGKRFEFKRLQAGHYFHGRVNATLFDERNVHAQCDACNRWKQGAGA